MVTFPHIYVFTKVSSKIDTQKKKNFENNNVG